MPGERKINCAQTPLISGQGQALNLVVGDRQVTPCDHALYNRFKSWIVINLTEGEMESYNADAVVIDHWDERAGSQFPYLLNPCECGTFLPIQMEPGPMLSSTVGLLDDLNRLKIHYLTMEPAFQRLVDALLEMANYSVDSSTPLEIR